MVVLFWQGHSLASKLLQIMGIRIDDQAFPSAFELPVTVMGVVYLMHRTIQARRKVGNAPVMLHAIMSLVCNESEIL